MRTAIATLHRAASPTKIGCEIWMHARAHPHPRTHHIQTQSKSTQCANIHSRHAQRLQVEKRLRVELGRLFWTVDFGLEDEMAQAGTGPDRAEGARQRSSLTPAV